jgi:uncharacterized protein YbjT (DUF2867 family)
MQGLVTVFGGSGFIGSQVVRALARQGLRIRVAVRQPGRAYTMRMLGDVGQIEVVQANIRNPASVNRALQGAEACINLVGVLSERGRQRFQSLHVQGAKVIAEAAKTHGVTRFVQMSALTVGSDSKYARTKGEGEAAVRAVYPDAVIIRPSIVFGPADGFFNRFGWLSSMLPALPLFGGGHTRFQPVFVGDVAAAIARAVTAPEAAGKTYELGGPAVYTFKELLQLTCKETGYKPVLLTLPFPIARLIGQVSELSAALIEPPLTADQVELFRTDNVVTPGSLGLADLGVQATAVEPILPTYLYRYRKGGQFADLGAAKTQS